MCPGEPYSTQHRSVTEDWRGSATATYAHQPNHQKRRTFYYEYMCLQPFLLLLVSGLTGSLRPPLRPVRPSSPFSSCKIEVTHPLPPPSKLGNELLAPIHPHSSATIVQLSAARQLPQKTSMTVLLQPRLQYVVALTDGLRILSGGSMTSHPEPAVNPPTQSSKPLSGNLLSSNLRPTPRHRHRGP